MDGKSEAESVLHPNNSTNVGGRTGGKNNKKEKIILDMMKE